jgi:NADH:ubiquinone oxidoreductase subunit 5 (subunit L)/multisubunit Na+/H+ antiporter MnhA subunit
MSVCSYLLIGFWYHREKAVDAGLKAMLTTKIGDLCLFLAILLFFLSTGSFDLSSTVFLSQFRGMISVLFVFAVLTKSAQFPFYYWLADAMEGPSTISALLHSATMVASGAFLLLRVVPILTPESLALLILCSIISLILAGFLALTNNDIKRILAFSTVSQLAFMILSISFFSLSSGFLHMINHAFFKSLLFLCTGMVIHYSSNRDIRKIAIGREYAPILFVASLIGFLSLAGIPPLSGFWSKELMLTSSLQTNKLLFILFIFGSFLTILYSLRLFFKIFRGGKVKEHFGFMEFSILALTISSVVLSIVEIFTIEFHLGIFLLSLGIIVLATFFSYSSFVEKFYTPQVSSLPDRFLRNEFYLNDLFLFLSDASLKIARKIYVKFENIISLTSEAIIFKTITWISRYAYKMLELDFTKIEEETLSVLLKKVYKFTKHSQSSYLNYNVLAVVVGIIILFFLVIIL